MKKFFIIFTVLFFLSCNNHHSFKDTYIIKNISGYEVTVILRVDGKRRTEFFKKNEKKEFTFERSVYAEISIDPPHPCYIKGNGFTAEIIKSPVIKAKVINRLDRNVKISSVDYNLPAGERETLLRSCIFNDTEISANTSENEGKYLEIYFYKLYLMPDWCGNVKIYTEDTGAEAALSYKEKTLYLTVSAK